MIAIILFIILFFHECASSSSSCYSNTFPRDYGKVNTFTRPQFTQNLALNFTCPTPLMAVGYISKFVPSLTDQYFFSMAGCGRGAKSIIQIVKEKPGVSCSLFPVFQCSYGTDDGNCASISSITLEAEQVYLIQVFYDDDYNSFTLTIGPTSAKTSSPTPDPTISDEEGMTWYNGSFIPLLVCMVASCGLALIGSIIWIVFDHIRFPIVKKKTEEEEEDEDCCIECCCCCCGGGSKESCIRKLAISICGNTILICLTTWTAYWSAAAYFLSIPIGMTTLWVYLKFVRKQIDEVKPHILKIRSIFICFAIVLLLNSAVAFVQPTISLRDEYLCYLPFDEWAERECYYILFFYAIYGYVAAICQLILFCLTIAFAEQLFQFFHVEERKPKVFLRPLRVAADEGGPIVHNSYVNNTKMIKKMCISLWVFAILVFATCWITPWSAGSYFFGFINVMMTAYIYSDLTNSQSAIIGNKSIYAINLIIFGAIIVIFGFVAIVQANSGGFTIGYIPVPFQFILGSLSIVIGVTIKNATFARDRILHEEEQQPINVQIENKEPVVIEKI